LLAVDTIALLDDVVASCLGTKFLPPVRNYLRRQVEEHVVAFLKTEEQWYDDTRLFTLEDSLETDPGIPGVVLRGRIDRISERQGSYIVVDYKTNVGRKVAGMVTPEGALYSFQVPVYVLLVEGNYGPVSQALYYDINKANYDSVFGGEKPWFDDEWRENLLLQTKETVAAMSQAIGESHYETPVPKGGCDPCELRSICREKYRVR
ncbi:MAG: PD-(D/E)XK nuclease family protein, partial [Spirochaetales bacterium]|nr:PD-(D/E)XK nuclease family protein [Spirochaetales bacterium]